MAVTASHRADGGRASARVGGLFVIDARRMDRTEAGDAGADGSGESLNRRAGVVRVSGGFSSAALINLEPGAGGAIDLPGGCGCAVPPDPYWLAYTAAYGGSGSSAQGTRTFSARSVASCCCSRSPTGLFLGALGRAFAASDRTGVNGLVSSALVGGMHGRSSFAILCHQGLIGIGVADRPSQRASRHLRNPAGMWSMPGVGLCSGCVERRCCRCSGGRLNAVARIQCGATRRTVVTQRAACTREVSYQTRFR